MSKIFYTVGLNDDNELEISWTLGGRETVEVIPVEVSEEISISLDMCLEITSEGIQPRATRYDTESILTLDKAKKTLEGILEHE